MAKRSDDFSFEFSGGKARREEPSDSEIQAGTTPEQFRILILGDFSGRTNRRIIDTASIAARKPLAIDADTFDSIMTRVNPQIQLPVNQTAMLPLSFKTREDFHPDKLLERVPAFAGLLTLRARLKDPATFAEAATQVRTLMGDSPDAPSPSPANPASPEAPAISDFEQLLQGPAKPRNSATPADALISSLVAGSSAPDTAPDADRLVAFVEDALSAGLRAVLHHPAFQAVESAWRGLAFLTDRLNTDEELKLNILDISREELSADLMTTPEFQKSGLYQIIVERMRAPGAIPYSLVIGDYEFDQSPESVALLAKIATLMAETRIPFIAGGSPAIAGLESFATFPDAAKWQPPADLASWEKIRSHKLAAHLGLAAPRFLLRMPYGPETDAIDAYPFEEMPGEPDAMGYLWGNGAFAVANVMGQSFLESGWGFEPGSDIADLPCHMATVSGEREMTPCAEAWLSDRAGDILHKRGLIPLISVRNTAAVKVAGVHSIAKDGAPLAASWANG